VESRFYWRGNDLGLDLVNTEAVDENGAPLDLLTDPDAVLEWAAEAGMADAALVEACRRLPRRQTAALLTWTRRLRSSARAVVNRAGETSAAGLGELAALLGQVPVRLTVPPRGLDGGLPVVASAPIDRVRLGLARAVIGTLALDRSRIRRCEGERCVLLYYDTSRNRSRRWCDMAACGNRAKAAAHYARSRAGRAR
jgi:predicted RNA-binding Zn ribbon-like protein